MRVQDTTPRQTALPFHAAFAAIEERRDLGSGPKRLHALLVSSQRLHASWTQAEMAAHLGVSQRSIVRWSQQLVDVGLLLMKRLGQGRPNAYTLQGIDEDNLAGRAIRRREQERRVYTERYTRLVKVYGEQCLRCGSTYALQIDHVVARARGGPDVFLNLQILCRPCNVDKGIRTIDYRPTSGVALAGSADPA